MGLLTPLAIRIGAIAWLPRMLPQIVRCDRALQRVTGHRASLLDLAGLPNLNFTVKGRRSGLSRTAPLLCVPDGPSILIAGSYFGGPDMPQWVGNLRAADGVAAVEYRGRTYPVLAAELDGGERAQAWQHMLRTWPNFARYEQRTSRRIPVFRLTEAVD